MEKERLAEHLERYDSGASNAATSWELVCAFGVKGKELRDAGNALRREGVPIASNGSGYFCAATEQEVRATNAHKTHRISGIAAALRGERSPEDAIETVKRESCRYAKRQLTWLRRDRDLVWLPREEYPTEDDLLAAVLKN